MNSYTFIASSTIQLATQRIGSSWEWYVIRAAGFVAVFLLFLLMLSGIGMVTGLTYRYFDPSKAWLIHKALGISLAVSVFIHGFFLLFDHYVSFNIFQVIIPFTATYKRTKLFGIPVGSLYVAFGILAMYLIAIVIASSLGWINTKKKIWRRLHYLNYLTVILVFFHAMYTGSDLSYGVFRKFWILGGLVVLILILTRLWRAGTLLRKSS